MKTATFYDTLTELPLHNFIKVLCTGKLHYVKKLGYATNRQLAEKWEDLSEQYIDLSGETAQRFTLQLMKEIRVIDGKLEIIEACVNGLVRAYNQGLVDQLRTYGFRYKFDPTNYDQYKKDLQLTVSKAKSLLMRGKERQKELDELQPKGEASASESEYDVYLAELSKHQGYRIDAKQVSVSEYLAIVKSFKRVNTPKNGR